MAVWPDIRYAVRTIARNPAVALLAIFALALGIGANTAIFSLVNGILLNSATMRSLRNPGTLVMLWDSNPKLGSIISERMPTAPENFLEWQRQSHSFVDMAAIQLINCNLTGGNAADAAHPERTDGIRVSLNFFLLLGIQPALGRVFTREDLQARKNNVAILSAKLFYRRFGNRAALSGQTLRVNGISRTIVGVLPSTLRFPAMYGGMNEEDPQVWLPLDLDGEKDNAKQRSLYVYARLKPGVALAQAHSEMNLIGKRLETADPRLNKGFGVNVFPLEVEDVGPGLRSSLLVLQAAVAFVLLIACANLANLLLARAVGREREMATRLALGARPSQILRQLLTESLALSLAGAGLALLLAHWILTGFSSLAPQDTPKFKGLHLEPLALGFTLLVALATGLLFGLAPAWHAARRDVNDVLARGGRASSRASNRLRGALVISEVALAFMLMIGAGLMIRSLGALLQVNTGLRPDHLLTMQIALLQTRYADPSQQKTFCDRLLESVRRLPGVQSAAIADGLPMENIVATAFTVPGEPVIPNESPIADHAVVTEGYFQTMGTPLLRGRTFTRADTELAEPRTVVLNESLAKIHWPKNDELGKTILMPVSSTKRLPLTIIGVVADTRQLGPDSPPRPELYTPSRVYATPSLVVRTTHDPMKMAPAIEKIVWSIDPEQPVYEVHTMEEILHEWVAQRRFNMVVLTGFATLALVLASLGLYGVLAYLLTLRTRELGIRMAVGAGPRQLIGLVIGQAIQWAAPGLAIGIAGALLLTHAMQTLIVNVSPADPLTFAGVAVILIIIALLASYLPARRAARVDPVEALRIE